MTKEELKEILELHKKWLNNEEGGKRANLNYADLKNANLSYANLKNADLSDANLSDANLSYADLSDAYLSNAYLKNADLSDANLSYANLSYADLSYAYLSNADLSYAYLSYAYLKNADLSNANLKNADLSYADLSYANLDENEKCRKGEILNKKIIGYKKCKDNVIVKLEIPKGAIVFGINGNKFRTNKAKCIDIENGDIAISNYDERFTYEKGKTYIIDDFDLMYNVECGKGIHFFKTRKEAEEYDY